MIQTGMSGEFQVSNSPFQIDVNIVSACGTAHSCQTYLETNLGFRNLAFTNVDCEACNVIPITGGR